MGETLSGGTGRGGRVGSPADAEPAGDGSSKGGADAGAVAEADASGVSTADAETAGVPPDGLSRQPASTTTTTQGTQARRQWVMSLMVARPKAECHVAISKGHR